jgi:CPA1 family monovalent cation:H+ antiporter
MAAFEHLLTLVLITTALRVIAGRLPWPEPITSVVGGGLASFIPTLAGFSLDPKIFFLCFLPPLLFSDGWLMPLREFAQAKRPIFLLATGLVVFTTLSVGLAAHALIPSLPLAMAFALGAVVSPTDAVAVSAIMERLKVPTRVKIVLTGESLMNDATGLVAFKFAVAAVLAGSFSLTTAAAEFGYVAVAGIGIGLAVAYLVGRLRDLLEATHSADALVEVTLSLLTPYCAYLAAEGVHASEVLAVVASGLYSGWRDPVRMDVETRQTAWTVWSIILFWLNGLAFVLLGLQFPPLLADVLRHYTVAQLGGLVAVIAATTMISRIAWFFPGAYLPYLLSARIRAREPRPSWRSVLVGGWAGMRGAVTLAAALSIPLALPDGSPFPGRDIVVFLAFGVIASTLVVQGTTLPWLIRTLGLREDNTHIAEERLARTAAVEAGLKVLRELQSSASRPEQIAALGQVVGEYERRILELSVEGETRLHAQQRRASEKQARLAAIRAERATIDQLWRADTITDEVHRPLQQLLDYEESMLQAMPAGTPSVPLPVESAVFPKSLDD